MPIFSIHLFGIQIAPSYYGLMYALGFITGYYILRSRKVFSDMELESLTFHVFLGVILGGRLWYVLFYNLPYYLGHPLDILKTWQWGMSFHGGVIGVIVAMGIYAIRHRKTLMRPPKKWVLKNMKKSEEIWAKIEYRSESYDISTVNETRRFEPKDRVLIRIFLEVADQVTSILPIGLWLGRIGNYLNGELLGFSPYAGPLAIVKNGATHFPSTLLEALFEGVVLFAILTYLIRHRTFSGQVATAFLFFYGVFRFAIEFVRSPDANIGYLAGGWLTMGHILSLPMILAGAFLYWIFQKKPYTGSNK